MSEEFYIGNWLELTYYKTQPDEIESTLNQTLESWNSSLDGGNIWSWYCHLSWIPIITRNHKIVPSVLLRLVIHDSQQHIQVNDWPKLNDDCFWEQVYMLNSRDLCNSPFSILVLKLGEFIQLVELDTYFMKSRIYYLWIVIHSHIYCATSECKLSVKSELIYG